MLLLYEVQHQPLTHKQLASCTDAATQNTIIVKTWCRHFFFLQLQNSYQQNHIAVLFTALEIPDRLREFAKETSCQKTAAQQMCTLACFNSPAAKLPQELKEWRKGSEAQAV